MFRGGKPAQRYIPGAGPPGSAPKPAADGKKKKNKKKANGDEAGAPVEAMAKTTISSPVVEAPSGDDAAAKKIRNLEKKVSIPCLSVYGH
jgi:translation initiation factor 2A